MVAPFGITFERLNDEPRSSISASMSVVGIVGTAPNANATNFPINTPIRTFTDNSVLLSTLGITGTIVDAIKALNDQLTNGQSSIQVVIVRVAEGADADATMVNIIGSSITKTGIWALPEAGSVVGVMPRIIVCPGYTSQQKIGVTLPVITAPGSGGTNGTFALAFTGGAGSGAAGTFKVEAGVVTEITITNGGSYTALPTASFTASVGLTGATASFTLDALANPVVAALPAVLEKMFAVMVASGPGTTLTAYNNWVKTIASERVIPVETGVKVGVSATVKPSDGYVAGLGVQTDFENGGVPSHSWANRAINGIVGTNRPIAFSLTDEATEGRQILQAKGGVIVRGEAGTETAIADSGFIFLGTDNNGPDDDWRTYSSVRMRDYIHLTLLKTLRPYLGRANITGHVAQTILNTMGDFLAILKAENHIIGYQVSFPDGFNTAGELRLGHLTVEFRAEEAPVLKNIKIRSAKFSFALEEMMANLQANLALAA